MIDKGKNIGIYKITNIINNKIYIGSSINIEGRWWDHLNLLNNKKHPNIHLQSAWNKYGVENFKFEIIECFIFNFFEREQYYLDTLLFANCDDNRFDKLGYNICRLAYSKKGVKVSDYTRKLLSEKLKGKVISDEHKIIISKTHKGKPKSEEHKKKISETIKNNLELIEKIRDNFKKPKTNEHRENLSKSHIGYKASYDTKLKMSISAKIGWEKRRNKK